ncbi:transglutaminase family protein [Adhaeretor mobilis]|uniref:Protein-glutamine gamma-glutamyltransferase n=1 Tax=Adhaeretor mobilis TaxID=1930276 RepID=A0A517MZF9_9BACT|nr:transglutaminase family protein [Adhaeretor mobilis]QDT00271.1 Protein-glutamine gamma-glutamyltransferase [Adhaeretor mobilis]
MNYRVTHTTTYKTTNRVSVCHNAAWLTPRDTGRQKVSNHEITIKPAPSIYSVREDVFGNHVTHFSLNEGYEQLEVKATSQVSVAPLAPMPTDTTPWESIVKRIQVHSTVADLDALQFKFDSPRSHYSLAAADYARETFSQGRPVYEAVLELTSRVNEDFTYDPKATTVTTPIAEVLRKRRGVCQDFAHVQIAMLRSLGLAARYVSGYVRTYPPAGKPRLVGADASHAWLSVYCGDLGWIDVDPTNDKRAGEEHITLSWGRDYGDVTPLKGIYTGGGKHALDVSVDVAPIETDSEVISVAS